MKSVVVWALSDNEPAMEFYKALGGRAVARSSERFGAKTCLLSWLPGVGDPLCAVAGWLKLPFWPCVGYMAIGKFLRYVVLTAVALWLWPGALGLG